MVAQIELVSVPVLGLDDRVPFLGLVDLLANPKRDTVEHISKPKAIRHEERLDEESQEEVLLTHEILTYLLN